MGKKSKKNQAKRHFKLTRAEKRRYGPAFKEATKEQKKLMRSSIRAIRAGKVARHKSQLQTNQEAIDVSGI